MIAMLPPHILALLCPTCLGYGGSPVEVPADEFGTAAHVELDECPTCHGTGASEAAQREVDELAGLREVVEHQEETLRAAAAQVGSVLAEAQDAVGDGEEWEAWVEQLTAVHKLLDPGYYE